MTWYYVCILTTASIFFAWSMYFSQKIVLFLNHASSLYRMWRSQQNFQSSGDHSNLMIQIYADCPERTLKRTCGPVRTPLHLTGWKQWWINPQRLSRCSFLEAYHNTDWDNSIIYLNWTPTKNGRENQLQYEMNQLELCLLAVRSWSCAGKFANWRTDFVGVLRFSLDPSRVAQLLQESSNLQVPSRLRRVALEKDWWICMSYWRMKQT